ncbi:MAG: NAD(P)H-quinone oxidoreductase [Chloroflexota bacterium]
MRAIQVSQDSKNPVLSMGEAEAPAMSPDEVRVEIKATAVNRADLMQARGAYPPPPGASEILGLEMAGVISELGSHVSGWQIGDRVAALLAGGGYAEEVVVHPDMLFRLPDSWSFAAGAAVPEVWLTAYVNLFLEGGLASGETILIHAGGSGVGTAAIQLARETGATPFVTAGSQAKLDACQALGAQLMINYKEADFQEAVADATGGEGVNLILDPVGGAYLQKNISSLSRHGRMVVIGLLGGIKGELNIAQVLIKNLKIKGSTLRARPLSEKIEITQGFLSRFWPLFLDGTLKPVVDRTFPLNEAQAAHQYVAENRNTGKVVLMVNGD